MSLTIRELHEETTRLMALDQDQYEVKLRPRDDVYHVRHQSRDGIHKDDSSGKRVYFIEG